MRTLRVATTHEGPYTIQRYQEEIWDALFPNQRPRQWELGRLVGVHIEDEPVDSVDHFQVPWVGDFSQEGDWALSFTHGLEKPRGSKLYIYNAIEYFNSITYHVCICRS
jgi:hypothetical protein